MKNIKRIRVFGLNVVALVAIALYLSGCSDETSAPKKPEKMPTFTGTLSVEEPKGKSAIPFSVNDHRYWYVSSENFGLKVVDRLGQIIAHQSGHYESLAVSSLNHTSDIIAASNNESGRIELSRYDKNTAKFQSLSFIDNSIAQIENQCFHQSKEGYVSLYVVDVRGGVDEWIVHHAEAQLTQPLKLRSFSIAPNTIACASDGNRIYFVEEHIGLWSVLANPETDPEREAVALIASEPSINENISGVSVLNDGTLLVSSEDANSVFLIKSNEIGLQVDTLAFHQDIKPRTAYGIIKNNTLEMTIYDDEGDQYMEYSLPYTSQGEVENKPENVGEMQQKSVTVKASQETSPVGKYGDAADDPAIWVNRLNPVNSRILGTDKRSGLYVYDLDGRELQHLSVGRLNNVDIRSLDGFGQNNIQLAAASNRTRNSISLFALNDHTGQVSELTEIDTSLASIYGLCMARFENALYVFVNDTNGRYQQYAINLTYADAPKVSALPSIKGQLVREFELPSQPEGCVADDEQGLLYMGEEAAGIWRISIAPSGHDLKQLVSVGPQLHADVEGLGLYVTSDNERFLIASSQGDNHYVIYQVKDALEFVGRFNIGINFSAGIDGTSETDGLEVTSSPLPGYEKGILVVQDGRNRLPDAPQNFKIIDWKSVENALFH